MPSQEFDITKIRNDFPTLNQTLNGNPLVYLDSGATSQKPQSVIDATTRFYNLGNANVHRGRHTLSERATEQYEDARLKTADYFNVNAKEIVWTKGATEALNLLAHGLQRQITGEDTVLITPLEHHANIVPWQVLTQNTGATLSALPLEQNAMFNIARCIDMITHTKAKVLCISQASNALGNITNLAPLVAAAKAVGTLVVVDGAQGAMHLRPNLKQLGCDFYVFSAHKMLGPTGVGGLYGRYELLNALTPYQTGGEMIDTVTLEKSTYRDAPAKFETGTPNIAGVIGFSAAIDYLSALNIQQLQHHEQAIFNYAATQLSKIDGITIYSDLNNNIGTLSFNYKSEHPYDLATLLDGFGIAVRSGQHCTQPLMHHLGVKGTVRASFAFYNTHQDVDNFINALKESIELLD
ncbi:MULTISPECIES: aminotransferase class V-fold PLP-dependent enzyme [unclassified Pseudoalteromonas]|uniref:aminotransferase class V-fold PLP-dependent enzyme n=1 Tax=unclassified Pseudoalteromonas TaxID=194690 RepID=UPI002358502B|nr:MULTISPECIES: SufS family cysteine desulfurase [unclassified Pseudoalteromonas]MDC9563099.1 SufS family cysteine desulfurase [Pseudoalteromonas sp. GAB2316C]MDC9567541.1 SufS family cysteine desulfurase [Pseudoalteromonas sp. GABNB9D]MDC9571761.1 SufS family cysteine desulfurase [Pseudoalteromonas sp. GABNS16A]MDC9576221.1 SufS family cysteine desulfurase [Pseudoalteromonas sp. GABNS16E]MDC9583546.1 SufS family cysteine desulfurase [Pseudoalteromonas sp. GABNS16C]